MMDELEVKPDERLRSCPFCGSKVAPFVTRCWDEAKHDYSEFQWQVVCNFNKGGCGGSSGVRGAEHLAIELWNRRAERITPEQAIEATLGRGECRAVSMRERDKRPYLNDEQVCSECGCQLAHEFGHVWQNYCPNCGKKVIS